MQKLTSGKEGEGEKAREALYDYAVKTPACRRTIVHHVIAAMDKPHIDFVVARNPGDPKKVDISQTTKASRSTTLIPTPQGNLISAQGTAQTALDGAKGPSGAEGTSAITKPIDQDGMARVNVSTTAVSAFASLGNFGSIRTSLNLTIDSKTNGVALDQNSQASGYPSIAAYSYVYQGKNIVTTEIFKQGEGSPDALKEPMKPILVAPK